MPQIRVLLGYQQGHVFCLREAMAIGRDPKSGIVLHPDSAASRRHAEIFAVNGHWRVRDLGSVNGTLLNGRRVKDEVLRDKDEVVIGDNVFVFEDGDIEAAQIAEAASQVNLAETRGFHNRPETQALVRSMEARARVIEAKVSPLTGGAQESAKTFLAAVIAGGHLLLDGAPVAASAPALQDLGELLGLKFARIELTPETKPTSISISWTEPSSPDEGGNGECLGGPLFSNLVLADGLQRAPLETRKLLLAAMADGAVTLHGKARQFEAPFVLVAAQSATERGATYPLSEAQLDQFMFSLPWQATDRVADRVSHEPIMSRKQMLELQRAAREMPVADHVVRYAVQLVRATRPCDPQAPEFIRKLVHAGAGPRAAQHLVLAAKARAVIEGRLLVGTGDVRAVAGRVLRHRVFTNFTAAVAGANADELIGRLLGEVLEPEGAED